MSEVIVLGQPSKVLCRPFHRFRFSWDYSYKCLFYLLFCFSPSETPVTCMLFFLCLSVSVTFSLTLFNYISGLLLFSWLFYCFSSILTSFYYHSYYHSSVLMIKFSFAFLLPWIPHSLACISNMILLFLPPFLFLFLNF